MTLETPSPPACTSVREVTRSSRFDPASQEVMRISVMRSFDTVKAKWLGPV